MSNGANQPHVLLQFINALIIITDSILGGCQVNLKFDDCKISTIERTPPDLEGIRPEMLYSFRILR